jgi:VWFA-related protein
MKLRVHSLLTATTVALTLALPAALPLSAQEPAFKEKIDVNLVLLDAVVTDRRGNQILGLGKDDFVVTENGVQQPVESLDYFTNRQLLTSPEQNADFHVDRVREERYFILFFDKPSENQLWSQVALARRAAIDMVEHQLQPNDRVAIAGHDVRLKIYSDFTSDKKQLRAAIDAVSNFGLGLKSTGKGGDTSLLANLDPSEMIERTGTVYEAINVLADATRSIHARKNLVLFSAGIYEPGESVSNDGVLLNTSRYYDPMLRALNAADVTVYGINLFQNSPNIPLVHQTLERMSMDTNGEYFRNAVNYLTPLKKIETSNNGYYLLTYHARHADNASGYQKVSVTLRNPEFRVRARDGYAYGAEATR